MPQTDFDLARKAMIDSQLRTSGVNDPWALKAMESVQREDFVPPDQQASSYMDRSIALGEGRFLNPSVTTAMMLTDAAPTSSDRVLLLGAGSGYVAALLAPLVESVCAAEMDDNLFAQCQQNLAGLKNVELVKASSLSLVHMTDTPFSLIWIDGAIEYLPETITDQLVDGGRIVTGLKEGPVTRLASAVKRGPAVRLRAFADGEIALLPGFAKSREFAF